MDQKMVDRIVSDVAGWPGISVEPHRFGGKEFKLNGTEIGHVHDGGMLDIRFTIAIRDELLNLGLAEKHHYLPETGWISYYLKNKEESIVNAVFLLKLAWLLRAVKQRTDTAWLNNWAEQNIDNKLKKLIGYE